MIKIPTEITMVTLEADTKEIRPLTERNWVIDREDLTLILNGIKGKYSFQKAQTVRMLQPIVCESKYI